MTPSSLGPLEKVPFGLWAVTHGPLTPLPPHPQLLEGLGGLDRSFTHPWVSGSKGGQHRKEHWVVHHVQEEHYQGNFKLS